MTWIDAEVHLFPPQWCESEYRPHEREQVLLRTIYDHPDRDIALAGASVDGALKEMERSSIDQAVIMGLPWDAPAMCWENNDYIMKVTRENPGTFIPLAILPSPMQEDGVASVRRIKEEGFVGVKVIPAWHGYKLDGEEMAPALAEMERLGLALFPHIDQVYCDPETSDTAHALYQVALRHPDLKIMAPHLGGLLCLYGLYDKVRPALKNILFITSVSATMDMVTFAAKAIGAENLAFGTDFPFNLSHDQLSVRERLESLGFDDETLAGISGGNLKRFLGM